MNVEYKKKWKKYIIIDNKWKIKWILKNKLI